MKVGILGGGRWGQALARLCMAAGHEPFIAYQGKAPPHILPSTDDPPKVSAACELILVATSASETRGAIRLAKPGPEHRIVVAGRGLEPASSRWLTDVVLEECDTLRVGALAGPAPIEEILNGGLCAGVIASRYEEVREMATAALHSSRYRVYDSADLTGVQLAGAMTPVLAALVGLARNLRGAGVGMHAMVLSRGLEEGSRLARALGADPMTFMGLAGAGDLVAAQSLPNHPHFEFGEKLAKGSPVDKTSGPASLAVAISRIAKQHRVELPLTDALVAVTNGASPIDAVQKLMGRAAAKEHR